MKRFSNILFVAEPDQGDRAALHRAIELANKNQAKLTLAGLVKAREKDKSATDNQTRELLDATVAQVRDELKTLLEAAQGNHDDIEISVLVGDGFLEITREVLRNKRDLLIKQGESINGIVQKLTSMDMKLVRKCPCPVWLLKPEQPSRYRRILLALAYDDSSESQVTALNAQLLQMSSSIALADSAQLHIVHAYTLAHEDILRSARTPYSGTEVDEMVIEERALRQKWLETLIAEHCVKPDSETAFNLSPQLHLEQGSPSAIVPRLAEKLSIGLIVMGTIGRTGIPGFLVGNTAENILYQVNCSLLAVKPPGFTCPVTLED